MQHCPGIHQLWMRWKQDQHQRSDKQSLGFDHVDPYAFSTSPPRSTESFELFPDHEEEGSIIYITSRSNSPLSPISYSSSEGSITQPITQSSHNQVEPHRISIKQKPLRPLPVAPRVPIQPIRKVRALPTPPSTPPPCQSRPGNIPPGLETATKMLHALACACDSPIVLATGLPTPNRHWLSLPGPDEFPITAPIDWDLLEEALGCY